MKVISLDTETTGLFIHKGCRPFMVTASSAYTKRNYLWRTDVNPFTREATFSSAIKKDITNLLEQHDTIVFHHANYDLQAFDSIGIPVSYFENNFDVHDTMIMSHAYKSDNRHGLKELCVQYAKYSDDDEDQLATIVKSARLKAKKLGWRIADKNDIHETLEGTQKEHFRCDYWVPGQLAKELSLPKSHPWHSACATYGVKDTERTLILFFILTELLQDIPNQSGYVTTSGTLFDKYLEARELIYPILDMEMVGIPVKPRALADAKALFTQRLADTRETLERLSGIPNFNPRSPKQLQSVLFGKFKFKPVKMGKAGPSCDKEVLSTLLSEVKVEGNRIPPRYQFILALKESRKEETTLQYINNYDIHSKPTPARPKQRVIQPFFSQTRTGTGRLSCTDPNTTNVGKKDMSNPFADDKKNAIRATLFSEILGIDTDHRFSLRKVFGPRTGEEWTCIDYDQFQLRIFAVVSESYDLIEGFERGEDIHSLVARTIFQKDDISDVERTAAKAINFGLLFGAGPAKIELLAGVPGLYNLFMANFPKAKIYLDTQSRLARKHGYVHTVGGYRLYVPREAPHAASCYVIQGTEAEIVKRAMVYCYEYYKELRTPTYRLLMMIHDELVFTAKKRNMKQLSHIMKLMVLAGTQLGIPVKVDAKITNTDWATREPLETDLCLK